MELPSVFQAKIKEIANKEKARALLTEAISSSNPRGKMSRAMSALAKRNGSLMREGRTVEIDAICAMAEMARGLTTKSKAGEPGAYSLVRNCARNALANLNAI
jgi:hypothetical protein